MKESNRSVSAPFFDYTPNVAGRKASNAATDQNIKDYQAKKATRVPFVPSCGDTVKPNDTSGRTK
jgi:hypothetical protein